MIVPDRAGAEALDREDPLADLRGEFDLPDGVVYLDGNSLGPPVHGTGEALRALVHDQWGNNLITGWTTHGWMDLPSRVGDDIAEIIGAAPGEVVVTDSTSVNLFKALAAGLALRPGRPVILSEEGNFPTDLYVAQGLTELLAGRAALRVVSAPDLEAALGDGVAVVTLTHVDFRTGRMHDLDTLTGIAHAAGALVLWDLSHSAGAMPLALDEWGVDLAVGCGYKYLNGGPGAPAFLFAAAHLQAEARQPLSGWLGHAAPFAFEPVYRPAAGIGRFLCGTPPILSLAALARGVRLLGSVDMTEVRRKSVALGDLFIELVAGRCGEWGFELASPSRAEQRGSQVSFRHAEGYGIVQALIARGVIGDFRVPDLLRFGLAAPYVRYVDVWDAVEALRGVMEGREWDRPEHRRRKAVT